MDDGYDQYHLPVNRVSVDYAIIINDYFSVGEVGKFRDTAAGLRGLPQALD